MNKWRQQTLQALCRADLRIHMRSSMQYPSHEYAVSMRQPEREAWPLVPTPYSPSRAGANSGNTGGPEDNLHPGDIGPPKKKVGVEPRTQKKKQGSFIYFWRLPLLNHSKKNSKCARTRAATETLRPTGKWYVNKTNKWSVTRYVNESTWHKHKHKHKRKRKHTITQTQHTCTVDLISQNPSWPYHFALRISMQILARSTDQRATCGLIHHTWHAAIFHCLDGVRGGR